MTISHVLLFFFLRTSAAAGELLLGNVEVTDCQPSWRKGQNFFGINLAFYEVHTDLFKVGSVIEVGETSYFIDAMNVPENCNKGVALVYVANRKECVDGTPWVHTSECGFGGTLLKTVKADELWDIKLEPVAVASTTVAPVTTSAKARATYKVGCAASGKWPNFDVDACCGEGYERITTQAGCDQAYRDGAGDQDDFLEEWDAASGHSNPRSVGTEGPWDWDAAVPGCIIETKGRRRGVFIRFNTRPVPVVDKDLQSKKMVCKERAQVTTWSCDTTVNFIAGAHYAQTDLTSACPNCSANPVYGVPNSNEKAAAYCKQKCEGQSTCLGFFYQRHINGHEICGFYYEPIPSNAHPSWNGHSQGSRICMKSSKQQGLTPRESTVHV